MKSLRTSLLAALSLCLASLAFGHDGPHSHDPKHPHKHTDHSKEAQQDWKRAPAPAEPVILEAGSRRYRWDSDWLQLPEGREWLGNTHGCIVVDAQNRVYLSADTGDAVLVYSPDGKLERSFGGDWGAGLHGLSIVQEATQNPVTQELETKEFLYLVHTQRQEVLKTTLEGEVLMRLGLPVESGKYADPNRYRPTSVAVAPDGGLYVADGYGLSWIHRFNADGEYIDSFGGPGSEPKHLRTPHGLWMDTHGENPTLLVADRENHRIARFALDGTFLNATDSESGLLRRPCHLQFHDDLAVVADLAGRVTILDQNLELVAQLGDNPDESQRANFQVTPDKWRDGIFLAPHCARFDSAGNLYVMDWNVAGRLTRLELLPD